MMAWIFNRDYGDLSQVTEFWPAYLAVYQELAAAGKYPYDDEFRGRIPGAEGSCEDTAIYLLQHTRHLRDHENRLAGYRASGWRDFDPGELGATPRRFAGVVAHSFCVGGTGWNEWGDSRLVIRRGSVLLLPGRARTRGVLADGKLLVREEKDSVVN